MNHSPLGATEHEGAELPSPGDREAVFQERGARPRKHPKNTREGTPQINVGSVVLVLYYDTRHFSGEMCLLREVLEWLTSPSWETGRPPR